MNEIFVNSIEELEELEVEYNLVDCGMSGQYPGYHWMHDDDSEVSVYYGSDIFN